MQKVREIKTEHTSWFNDSVSQVESRWNPLQKTACLYTYVISSYHLKGTSAFSVYIIGTGPYFCHFEATFFKLILLEYFRRLTFSVI